MTVPEFYGFPHYPIVAQFLVRYVIHWYLRNSTIHGFGVWDLALYVS